MTVEEYRQSPGLNFSSIKHILRSPAHFLAGRGEQEPSLAMRMGSAVDEYVLEGKVRPYAIKPQFRNGDPSDLWQGNKKWCKEWISEKKVEGVSIYSRDEWDKASRMQQALLNSPEFSSLLEMCPNRQTPMFGKYRGLDFKILIDMDGHDSSGNRCLGDLKTANDGSPRGFAKKAYDYDYDIQICLYSTILSIVEDLGTPPSPFWAVVEESQANPVTIYAVPPLAWESGQRKLDKCVDLYLQCTESGEWPAYGSGVQQLQWPTYAK
jgi:hypothetical protein